ncbi:MAG: PqqD family protein [Lachnospiraceae bacterium]|nr:PqqD family protein [Lachnospiraceae bacterium]
MILKSLDNYEIHKAAGTYFLVNMAQKGDVFEKPVEVNEFGALVVKLIKEGKSEDEAAKLLADEYEADFEEVKKDVSEFTESLYEKIG